MSSPLSFNIQSFKNIFKPTLINILVATILILIILLTYLKTSKFELFSNLEIDNSFMNFINKLINRKKNENIYKKTLATRSQTIAQLADKVEKVINDN